MLHKYSVGILILVNSLVFAQHKDSVKIYDLDEITVEAGITIEPKPTLKFDQKFLARFAVDAGAFFVVFAMSAQIDFMNYK